MHLESQNILPKIYVCDGASLSVYLDPVDLVSVTILHNVICFKLFFCALNRLLYFEEIWAKIHPIMLSYLPHLIDITGMLFSLERLP